jgi:hypothetical protein
MKRFAFDSNLRSQANHSWKSKNRCAPSTQLQAACKEAVLGETMAMTIKKTRRGKKKRDKKKKPSSKAPVVKATNVQSNNLPPLVKATSSPN